jgi:hypothetical protein
MKIKELNEQLEKYTEASLEKNWRNVIDFDNIGCGFEVETGTSTDEFFTLNLEGYSANSSKNLCFKSDSFKVGYGLDQEARKEMNDKFVAQKELVKEALLQAANEFDKKIEEIMANYGFTKNED